MAGHNTICGMQKEDFCYWLVGARKLIIQKMSQITEKMIFLVCVPGVIMPHHEDGMRR